MLRANRPPEMASMVADSLATRRGCMVGACDVENTAEYFVEAATPAAQVNVSRMMLDLWSGLSSRYPFQRAMGTMASRPASSASFADASVFCHVGIRISGTKLMLGIVFVQKVPSFSLLELKMGFVELLVTRVILPEISRITQSVEPVGSGHVATLPADFPRVYIRQNDPLARITESV